MLARLLSHNIRKELLKINKKHNHREYLRALELGPAVKYWSGYHKKKLIFFALVTLIGWTYDMHLSAYYWFKSIRTPKQLLAELPLVSPKVEKTIKEMEVPGWQFSEQTKDLLTKVYYETDKRLIFGVGRHYMFKVMTQLGLLQKTQEQASFWAGGGFYRRRNQLVSGMSYKQFLTVFQQGYNKLSKNDSELDEAAYVRRFMESFVHNSGHIQQWQTSFNERRHGEYLKSQRLELDSKIDQINRLMHDNIDISLEQVEKRLIEDGLRGMSLKDKWVYWSNREILLRLRESTIRHRLDFGVQEWNQRMQMQERVSSLGDELSKIKQIKDGIKSQYAQYYEEQLFDSNSV